VDNHILSVLFSTRNRLQQQAGISSGGRSAPFSPLLNEEQTATLRRLEEGQAQIPFSPLLNEEQTATLPSRSQPLSRQLSVLFSTRNRLQQGVDFSPQHRHRPFQSSSQRGTDCNEYYALLRKITFAFQSSSQRGTDCNPTGRSREPLSGAPFSPLLNEEQTAT